MSIVDWPDSMPQVCLVDPEITPQAGLLDEEEERNPQRTRTEPEEVTTFRVLCTAAQLATFRAFYSDSLNGGCACFNLPWLGSFGLDHHFVRLTGGPSWQRMGIKWVVSLPVEIVAGADWPALPPEVVTRPVITGGTKLKNTLSCSPGVWKWEIETLTYQWLRDGVALDGANNNTYVITEDDCGTQLSCIVAVDNSAGSGSCESDPVTIPALPDPVTAKSVVFDFTDSWGGNAIGIRSIEFTYRASVLAIISSDFSAYSTTQYSTTYAKEFAFDTSLPKTGTWQYTTWSSVFRQETNQRLIIVFNTEQTFDGITINNLHNSGAVTDRGAKNTVITISPDEITDIVHGDDVSNGTVIFDGQIAEHVESDIEDNQELDLDL